MPHLPAPLVGDKTRRDNPRIGARDDEGAAPNDPTRWRSVILRRPNRMTGLAPPWSR